MNNCWIENDIIPDLNQSEKDWLIENFDGRLDPEYNLVITWENELPLSITKKFMTIGKHLGLKLSTTSVFTGTPGKMVLPHIDKIDGYDPMPWRLSYFVQGGCPFYWWEPGEIVRKGPYALIQDETVLIDSLDTTETKSAFLRTEVPHNVDMTGNDMTRIVVTATYRETDKKNASWDYLTNRLK
tara:strand:+ start:495 stop:1046 length:552 start_codon:yes stop_codon:yes gene_type:complete